MHSLAILNHNENGNKKKKKEPTVVHSDGKENHEGIGDPSRLVFVPRLGGSV